MWLSRLNVALGPVVGLYWRLGLAGERESIPRTGPLLLASNHSSFLDPWFIALCFPRRIRWLITHEWYHRSPVWRQVFRAYGTEPVRGGDMRGTLEAVCRLLDRGDVVGIFPEGRISPNGRIGPFRRGLAVIAARSGAPVVPLGLRGNHDALPRHRRFPRPKRVTVVAGAPLSFPGAPHRRPPPRVESLRFQERLLREVCRLAGQEERIPELLLASSPGPG
jgi:1-acyl-sn-glycerol-3-phosphate acyltransferase